MTVPQNLRVIGSRSIYRYFLPPSGEPFTSSEFILADPAKAQQFFVGDAGENSITIVINPFEYSRQSIELLPGEVWLWFLKRVAASELEVMGSSGKLAQQAREILESRKYFVRSIKMRENWTVIVSDAASRDFCETHGVRAILSPPPVRPVVQQQVALTRPRKADFLFFTDPSDYGQPFHLALSRWARSGSVGRREDFQSQQSVTHSVVTSESVVPSFPYEVAISLCLGKCVLAAALTPRWGLEPGIDFIEFSTPDELFHLVEMIHRFPQSTQLMAERGILKGAVFSSSSVFSRLLVKEINSR